MLFALLFDVFVGQYASITSGALGLCGSIAFAVPPIKSWAIRKAALKREKLESSERFGEAARRAAPVVTENLQHELIAERRCNLTGASLLFCSFLTLILHAVWTQ